VLTRRKLIAGAIPGLALTACSQNEARFPSRELKLVVQAAPGGISDTVSRVIASLMEKRLGVPVVCENKPGAAGALAFSYVTRRQPDGYTFGHGPVEIAMVRTLGFADVGPGDMDLLCLVTKTQPVLAVQSESPWRSFKDFTAAAASRPGHYVVANSGTGSIWHINALLMERAAELRLVHCPFNGSSGALTTLLGGHVDAAVAGAGEAVSHVEAGRLRVLAVFDRDRSSLFPEAPSVAEEGFDFGASAWSGFYAPAGVPPERSRLLVESIQEAFESGEFQTVCKERGMEALFLGSEEFREFALEQAAFFGQVIPELLRGMRG